MKISALLVGTHLGLLAAGLLIGSAIGTHQADERSAPVIAAQAQQIAVLHRWNIATSVRLRRLQADIRARSTLAASIADVGSQTAELGRVTDAEFAGDRLSSIDGTASSWASVAHIVQKLSFGRDVTSLVVSARPRWSLDSSPAAPGIEFHVAFDSPRSEFATPQPLPQAVDAAQVLNERP